MLDYIIIGLLIVVIILVIIAISKNVNEGKIRFSCRAYFYVASCLHGKTDANQRYA